MELKVEPVRGGGGPKGLKDVPLRTEVPIRRTVKPSKGPTCTPPTCVLLVDGAEDVNTYTHLSCVPAYNVYIGRLG